MVVEAATDAGTLAGRRVVVTGASRGLGRTIAETCAASGADVALLARDAAGLDDAAVAVRAAGRVALPLVCDVSDPAAVAEAGRRIIEAFGTPDVVVANAGEPGPTRTLHELSLEEWRGTLASNLDSVFLTFRAFIPGMIERGSGSLVAIASITGRRPLAGRTPYAAAKLGVVGLVRTLAVELGPHGVRANTVSPGPVAGERLSQVIAARAAAGGMSSADLHARVVDEAALRRSVSPAEVAAACAFLASDAASGITGEDLDVSAGTLLW